MHYSNSDPTALPGRWDALHDLLRHIDGEIETLYRASGIEGIRPRFAYPLIRLRHTGPISVNNLADSLGRSQSAMSQTLSAMRNAGLIETRPGADSRTREVFLTEYGASLIPYLEAEWRATEAVVTELDDEAERMLSRAVERIKSLLMDRPVSERLSTWMRVFEAELGDAEASAAWRPDDRR